jgi:predicted NBD/HSP70 family sugar kinase
MKNSDRSFIRTYNRYNILNAIRIAGMVSRIDISKSLGLSKASLTGITSELIEEGLVIEKQPGAFQVGRRPMLLAINPDGAYAVGVSITISRVQAVIINFQAEVKVAHAVSLGGDRYDPKALVKKIATAVAGCIKKSGFDPTQIAGVGVSVPGLVDAASGIVRYLPNYGWTDVAFREMLRERIGFETFIDNDANNVTIAEHWFGEGCGADNLLVIIIENGIGAGCVLNGQLVRGDFGIAGEFGHMSIDPHGPLCRCGRRGCVEAYAGIFAIMKDVARITAHERRRGNSRELSFAEVVAEAGRSNGEFREIFHHAGRMLGIGIAQLITLLNPRKIILTGTGVQAGELMFTAMHDAIEGNRSEKIGNCNPEILIKNWTSEDFARGAGTLVLQEIYKSPVLKG